MHTTPVLVEILLPPSIDTATIEGRLKSAADTAATLESIDSGGERDLMKLAISPERWEGDTGGLITILQSIITPFSGGQITSLSLPERSYHPPRFGYEGLRKALNKAQEPLLFVRLSAHWARSLVDYMDHIHRLHRAGADVVIDAPVWGDRPEASILERVDAYAKTKASDAENAEDGPKKRYAVNLSGRADVILRRAKTIVDAGADAIAINPHSYGFSVVEALAAHPQVNVPIVGNSAAPQSIHPSFAPSVYLGSLYAHCGLDVALLPKPSQQVHYDQIRDALNAHKTMAVLPVKTNKIDAGADSQPQAHAEGVGFYLDAAEFGSITALEQWVHQYTST